MSDRLKELQRQRVLLQEHLDWLDREIARESGAPGRALATGPTPLAPPSPADPAQSAAMADQILSQYKSETQSPQSTVQRGCFLYLFLAFILFGLGLLALYLYSVRK